MRAFPPNRFPRPGRPLIAIDPRIVLSNIVNTIISANHHPTSMRALDGIVMAGWFQQAIKYVKDDQDAADIAKMFSDDARRDDFKSPMKAFLRQYAPVVAALLLDPVYHRDAGEEMRARLLETGDWDEVFVTSPSLGYPRRYLSFKYPLEDSMPLFGTSIGRVDAINWAETMTKPVGDDLQSTSRVQTALARLCYLWDRVFMNDQLIPEAVGLTKRDSREQFIGSSQAAISQQRYLTSLPLLYLLQYTVLWPQLTHKLEKHCYGLARSLYPRDEHALDVRDKMKTAVISRVPLHPILRMLVSVFDSELMMSTYFGTHDALQLPTGIQLPDTDAASGSRSSLAQLILVASLNEEYRLASIAGAARNEEWIRALIQDAAPSIEPGYVRRHSAISAGSSFAAVAEDLARWARFVGLFPDHARRLGWGATSQLHLGELEAAGADFVLTDGDYYSRSPVMVLTGLSPSLPTINPMVNGFARRFASDFNTGPSSDVFDTGDNGIARIKWSTLTVKPFITALEGDEALAHFYIPAGMSMGELNAETRYAGADVNDPIGKRVGNYYRTKSPKGFVRIFVAKPESRQSRVAANLTRIYTDWETAIESPKDPDGAQEELLAAYGSSNVDNPVDMLLYRPDWRMRVPVQMSRSNRYGWLNELGAVSEYFNFDGNVAFDDNLDLPNDTGAIDSLVSLLPIASLKLPDVIDTPASPPEG